MTGMIKGFAVASSAALAVMTAGSAEAQMFGGGNFYAKGFAGFTFAEGQDTRAFDGDGNSLGFSLDYEHDSGYTVGGAFGYDLMPQVGLELEYAYRAADLDSDLSGETNSNAVMLNAIYNFTPLGATGAWTPYVGGGLGWANVDVSTDDFGNFTRNDAFAYQLIGGVSYAVSPQVSVLGEVRWFATDNGKVDGDDDVHFDADFQTIDLLLGLTYRF
jgi:opacity protein-like surface antigen